MKKDIKFLVVDLFCGAGGTTLGFEFSELAEVIACVNHDPKAIESHHANNPNVKHFEEDIRTLDLSELTILCEQKRTEHPDAKLILWASLECTNFSKAKGGQPRDADSRTLANHLDRYVIALCPDYIQIENVVEFMAWGPLDDHGKPISRKNGADWRKWRTMMCDHGYRDEWRQLNAADFGAYTSRNRLFGIFAKGDLPIKWPEPTHSKKPLGGNSPLAPLKKWKPVKEVLDFSDEGRSIFGRKKPLSDRTLERIYAGLIKYVAGGKDNFLAKIYAVSSYSHGTYPTDATAHTITTRDAHALIQTSFISKYYSGNPEGKNIPIEGPAGTITCIDSQALVQTNFISQYNSGHPEHRVKSINEPCNTVTTNNRFSIVSTKFLMASNGGTPSAKVFPVTGPFRVITTSDNKALVSTKFLSTYYGNGSNTSVNKPSPTVTTKDRLSIISPSFIYRDFRQETNSSINTPAGAITTVPKMNLITTETRWNYLINPSWSGNTHSTDNPCPVIVARQDKSPLYIIQADQGNIAIAVDETDSEQAIKIKEFMVLYGIVDIKMRMLKIPELLKIQGFPSDYQLIGTQADQKKFIGNSVCPDVVKCWTMALAEPFNEAISNVA